MVDKWWSLCWYIRSYNEFCDDADNLKYDYKYDNSENECDS